MKNIIDLIIGSLLMWCAAMISSPALQGAEKENTNESGMTAGISLGLSDANSFHHIGMIIRPNLGYRINRHWETGVTFRFENTGLGTKTYTPMAYGQYNFHPFTCDRLSVFVDFQGGVLLIPLDYDSEPGAKEPDDCYAEIGFVPGLKYNIPGCNAALKLRYLFLGYSNCRYVRPHGIGHGPWALDASLRRLEIGISINF